MRRILFVLPINRSYVIMPPIGLGYLASVARETDYEPDILDCLKGNLSYEDFEEYIVENPADIYGISMMTYDFNSAKKHIRIIRKHFPQAVIVLGGSHPSGDYENILKDFPEADFAFRGEAELGFKLFLDELRKEETERHYSKIPNLIWRDDGEITVGPWRVVEDLDSISFPAWDLIDPRTYPEAPHGGFAKNFPVAPITITRGCPFKCTFCSGKTVTGSTVRKRSIGNAIDEIRLLVSDYGVREIHIEDENFTMHKALVIEFCIGLIEERLNVSWTCPSGVRIDTLDSEMLGMMKKSGCYSLAVGIEFGTDRIHALTKKRLTLDVIERQLDLLSRFDIRTTGFFMMGIPGETREDMLETIKFAKKVKIDRAQFNNFMPLPGSEIYNELRSRGELDSIDPDHFFVHDVGYVPQGMKKSDIKNLQRRAYLEFYLRPRIIYGLLKDIKTPRHSYLLMKRFLDGIS
jgi:radical SAM superfamily enzyme YgiQ (UPF0313 family)